MDVLSNITCLFCYTKSPLQRVSTKPVVKRMSPTVSMLRATSQQGSNVGEVVEEDVLRMFTRERALNGDFISKACDKIFQREAVKFTDVGDAEVVNNPLEAQQVLKTDTDGGFLKLSRTQEWLLGSSSAPMNERVIAKARQDDCDRRKKLNFLRYEALKRELLFLSVVIGTACSGYCLLVLSVQAAVSYVIGVLFSCLYLQLLCQHADNITKEKVPQIFMQKKSKKIGIRSEDLRDSFEKAINGSSIALSSPRLVIPAAIYGLWSLSHHYFPTEFFDFQLVPAMVGMFVYKAAALVQVYRDNEDLQFDFPENEEGSE